MIGNILFGICVILMLLNLSIHISKRTAIKRIKPLSAKDALKISEKINSTAIKLEKMLYYEINNEALVGNRSLKTKVNCNSILCLDAVVSHLIENGYNAKWYYDAELDHNYIKVEW